MDSRGTAWFTGIHVEPGERRRVNVLRAQRRPCDRDLPKSAGLLTRRSGFDSRRAHQFPTAEFLAGEPYPGFSGHGIALA